MSWKQQQADGTRLLEERALLIKALRRRFGKARPVCGQIARACLAEGKKLRNRYFLAARREMLWMFRALHDIAKGQLASRPPHDPEVNRMLVENTRMLRRACRMCVRRNKRSDAESFFCALLAEREQ